MNLKSFQICVLSLCLFTSLYGGPANKNTVTVNQPDGTTIQIKLFGDEFYYFAETLDGFTVLRDKNGFWTYAVKNGDGYLQTTNVIVHQPDQRNVDEDEFLAKSQKHLRPNHIPDEERIKADILQRVNFNRINKLRKSNSKTVWRVAVILVEFPDLIRPFC